MTEAERATALEAIAAEVAVCSRCRLHEGRTRSVPGEGSADTEVVFIGEGPGFNEDRQGRPFVGRAGKVLVDLLGSIGWRREDVFITNVVKCRPPDNRDPEPDEIAACSSFLARQLEVLDPALIVTLGRHSMGKFMPGARISQVHGTYRPADSAVGAPDALVFAMYHPAAADRSSDILRQSQADMRSVPQALLDARRLRDEHAGARSEPAPQTLPASAAASEPLAIAPEATAPEAPSLEAILPPATAVPVPTTASEPSDIEPPASPEQTATEVAQPALVGPPADAASRTSETVAPPPSSGAARAPVPEPAVPVPSVHSAPAELEPDPGQLTLF